MKGRLTPLEPGPVDGVYLGAVAQPGALNCRIRSAFERLQYTTAAHRTHCVAGRFENIYINRERIPEIDPLIEAALAYATDLLRRRSLKAGFWFNAMAPGQATSLHSHDEADELLSGVYYVAAPPACGDLVLHARGEQHFIAPCAGRFVLFPPALLHAVEANASRHRRLSIAFNIGPAY